MRCIFLPTIAYGQTGDLGAWRVFTAGGPEPVLSVTVSSGRILVTFGGLQPAIRVAFTGPPPYFRATDQGILESFDVTVPFP